MSRTKVEGKNKSISISLTQKQIDFLNSRPNLSFSKLVQLWLDDYIEFCNGAEITVKYVREIKNRK